MFIFSVKFHNDDDNNNDKKNSANHFYFYVNIDHTIWYVDLESGIPLRSSLNTHLSRTPSYCQTINTPVNIPLGKKLQQTRQ